MAITFKSKATGDLFMLSAHAEALLAPLGKQVNAPGILTPGEMPAALAHLRGLRDEAPTAPHETMDAQDADEVPLAEQPVSLHNRAVPLMRMIEEAMSAQEAIVWGV
jgi:Domain of unknown function (DUF1840)